MTFSPSSSLFFNLCYLWNIYISDIGYDGIRQTYAPLDYKCN